MISSNQTDVNAPNRWLTGPIILDANQGGLPPPPTASTVLPNLASIDIEPWCRQRIDQWLAAGGGEISQDSLLNKLQAELQAAGHGKISRRALRKLFDAVVAEGSNKARGSSRPSQQKVRQIIENAPVSDTAVVPEGWSMTATGISKIGGNDPTLVLPAPLVISKRLNSLNDGNKYLELAWLREGRWHFITAHRAIIASKNKIVELAGQGLPVTSNNAASAVTFLSDYETQNLAEIQPIRLTQQLGWASDMKAFLWGSTVLASKLTPQNDIVFQGADDGDDQIAQGFHSQGSSEKWQQAVEIAIGFPKIRLAILASLCAPLLELLDSANPIVELHGDTSQGKTVTLRFATSVWGNPDERSTKGVMFTWDVTRVGAERSLATANSLPVVLDDTRRSQRAGSISQILYDVVSGRGRKRGSIKGTQRANTWRTVLITSGESSVKFLANQGGARARVVSLSGSPFGGVSNEIGTMARTLNDSILANYGHAGPIFVQFLLDNAYKWSTWKSWHRRIALFFASRAANDPVLNRMSDVFATLTLTGILAKTALGIRLLAVNPIKTLWNELTTNVAETDVPAAALRYCVSWADSHEAEFRDAANSRESQPPGGWAGRWNTRNGRWAHIAFYPSKLSDVLKAAGFEYEAIVASWKARGWLHLDSNGHNPNQRVAGRHARLVAITREAITALNGPDAQCGEPDSP
ncbi:MAG TPA: DUF927 domain-containing protein [Gemmataceae bacterium]|nr:DUF927 domain-containing protein [Gemmataceae bacterium]